MRQAVNPNNSTGSTGSAARTGRNYLTPSERIEERINKICDKALQPDSSFDTKRSALEQLCRIGEDICVSDGAREKKIRISFQRQSCLDEGMVNILSTLPTEEIEAVAHMTEGEELFVDRLEDLVHVAKSYCMLDSIGEAYAIMRAGVDGEHNGAGDVSDGGSSDSAYKDALIEAEIARQHCLKLKRTLEPESGDGDNDEAGSSAANGGSMQDSSRM